MQKFLDPQDLCGDPQLPQAKPYAFLIFYIVKTSLKTLHLVL
jgi:hypothetical protein